MDPPYLLPIEVIFNLLCVCRRIRSIDPRALRRAMYQRGLYYGTFEELPHFGFWVRLCQSASLLDESRPPRPTLLVPDWLALPWEKQIASLLDAWQLTPTSPRLVGVRTRLLRRLRDSSDLSPVYQRELPGLQALGLCDGDLLTTWGRALLNGQIPHFKPPPPQPWILLEDELQVPYPPNWRLLWELEYYLKPIDPGVYPASEPELRVASQHKNRPGARSLSDILADGFRGPPPEGMIKLIESLPTIKVMPGVTLEFSSPEEIIKLRESPSMRRDLATVLSPHHVHLDLWHAHRILRRLYNRGLLVEEDIALANPEQKNLEGASLFSRAERAYLLSLMLFVDGLEVQLTPPLGMLKKLTAGLGGPLRAAAARKAQAALEKLSPDLPWTPETESPPVPEPRLIENLEQAIRRGQAVDFLYQAASKHHPEHRHVTPLLLEQRGLRFYLIAYCHTRRANRTFRLDRIQWLDAPPLP